MLLPEQGVAEIQTPQERASHAEVKKVVDEQPKTDTIYIHRDGAPAPSVEENDLKNPFYNTTPFDTLMERIEILEKKTEELAKKSPITNEDNIHIQTNSGIIIKSIDQDVTISTPGTVTLDAKEVIMPPNVTKRQQNTY